MVQLKCFSVLIGMPTGYVSAISLSLESAIWFSELPRKFENFRLPENPYSVCNENAEPNPKPSTQETHISLFRYKHVIVTKPGNNP